MKQNIDAKLFLQMMQVGAQNLKREEQKVNALNVFPVPDGDTGTNMNLTIQSGVREMESLTGNNVGQLANNLARGLLLGARGNSGVILSQLFRGFAIALKDKNEMDGTDLAEALRQGVKTAYKAVIKPVEGTILTVAKESAEAGLKQARLDKNFVKVLIAVLRQAQSTLARTPEMLPILKQTKVVDAGGQGLVFIYEGMLSALMGEVEPEKIQELSQSNQKEPHYHHDIDPATIVHGYCTEFLVNLDTQRRVVESFSEELFRSDMGDFGDSLLVIADDNIVKVHIHAEHPGSAMEYAMKYGDLTGIKIDNMRDQYADVVEKHKKKLGIVAVASGEGLKNIFLSLGVDAVIEGGQTMNPSTEDIAKAARQISAQEIVILPNNKNIILTAEQVENLVSQPITVLPTRTVPQGLAAMLAFREEKDLAENEKIMLAASNAIKSGEVTYAVRDSEMNGLQIKKDNYIGIMEGTLTSVGETLYDTTLQLVAKMLQDGGELLTLIYGEETAETDAIKMIETLQQEYPQIEVELQSGGQPHYYFILSVE